MISSVKIGGIVYDVVVVSGLFDGDVKLNGHIMYSDTRIEIEEKMSTQCSRVVLLHEVIHGILTQAGVEHEERLVEVLAYGLVGVLQDNPGIME